MSEKQLLDFIKNTGSFRENVDLSKINWFRVGGSAKYLFKPKSISELSEFLRLNKKRFLDFLILGVGSNVIVRDQGVDGVVIRLGKEFAQIEKLSDNEIQVGAGCLDINLARFAKDAAISKLEFFSGIPGTIGGALKMNAGAYGLETKDVLVKAFGVDMDGQECEFLLDDMNFSYRKSEIGKDIIFTKAIFRGEVGDKSEIANKIQEIQEKRETTQPIKSRTGGSTFKNPDGMKAWELIDKAGCRGLQIGGAKMSELHCNFMINTGDAIAADLENLGEEVRRRVKENSGVDLQWEIKFI
jgi:UDP-N-acetylmuramate dehydrogenase